MNKIREWLIHKLGGYVLDPYDGKPKDYWVNRHIEQSIYVSKEHCKPEYIDNLENELADRLVKRLIEGEYIGFRVYDEPGFSGHVLIYGGVNILDLKEHHSYNTPRHITFKEEVER